MFPAEANDRVPRHLLYSFFEGRRILRPGLGCTSFSRAVDLEGYLDLALIGEIEVEDCVARGDR